jgi:hypothetical protein
MITPFGDPASASEKWAKRVDSLPKNKALEGLYKRCRLSWFSNEPTLDVQEAAILS